MEALPPLYMMKAAAVAIDSFRQPLIGCISSCRSLASPGFLLAVLIIWRRASCCLAVMRRHVSGPKLPVLQHCHRMQGFQDPQSSWIIVPRGPRPTH